MKFFKKIFAVCALCYYGHLACAQTDSILESKFTRYQENCMQEKLFVHTDKNFYVAGEIVWMRVYDVDAYFHRPLAISSIAYVEILDRNNKSLLQAKLSLKNGDGDGSIYLPVTLNSGNYILRAYTNWMKNFSPEYFFQKNITVINTQKIFEKPPTDRTLHYDIQFFPEGGNLVNSMESKIAFRIADQYGRGSDARGFLVDNDHDTITQFNPHKFGLGNFSFTPREQHKYKAVVLLADGKYISRELPAAQDSGYAMHLIVSDTGQIRIVVREKNVSSSGFAYLLVHTRGLLKWVGSSFFQNGEASFTIDKNRMGEGISQITVFNEERIPLCERLYFTYPKEKLQLAVQADQQEYATRKKIDIRISSGKPDGKPASANMSMAVYRLDSLQGLDETDISNYLWLTSDLAGPIESPDYYFENGGAGRQDAVDNLMLTHGWRRFRWEDVLQNKKPAFDFIPEYKRQVIVGKITDTRTGLPAKDIDAYLSVPGNRIQFADATSDGRGIVSFILKDTYGPQEFIAQTNTQKDSNYKIDILNPFSDRYSATRMPDFSMPDKKQNTLLDESINMQVQNIFVGNKLQQSSIPLTDTTAFYVEPDEKYLLDNYTRFTTMEEVMREYVKGVNVSKRGGKFHLPLSELHSKDPFKNDPLALVDGVPVFDLDKLMSYDPLKVYKIELVDRKYSFGNQDFDGILSLFTYNGDLSGFELDPHAVVIDYEGLQLQRTFYSPVYETEQQISSHMPDFRNLLFWSPEIKTDKSGKQTVNFYSSDLSGKYVILIQGLSAEGLTGSQTAFFEVKDKIQNASSR
jgi:hypothetical protein